VKAAMFAGLIGFAAVAVACGSSAGAFPEEAECVVPAPLPTSRANPGTVSGQAYTRRLQGFAQNLEVLRSSLRAKYEDDTFYRRDEFRPDFAEYASQTVCTAQAMLDISPPDARYAGYDATLDAALADLIDHTRFGREAVRKRNVSEYRDWYRDADRKISAVRQAASTVPR
jgi:hypothetical protein